MGRLEHHAVAGDERAARWARGQGHREVERADHGPYAVGPEDVHVLARRAHGLHRGGEAVVLLHLVAVPPEQVGRLLHVAQRFQPVLPDLHGHERRELTSPFGDEVGGLANQRHPLLPRGRRPGRREGPCCRHGVPNVLPGGLGELPDHQIVVDRGSFLLGSTPLPSLPVHVERVALPQPGPGHLDASLVGLVQLLVVGRHGRVGDAEALLCHGRRLLVETARSNDRSMVAAAPDPSQVAHEVAARIEPARGYRETAPSEAYHRPPFEARDLRPMGAPATGSAP